MMALPPRYLIGDRPIPCRCFVVTLAPWAREITPYPLTADTLNQLESLRKGDLSFITWHTTLFFPPDVTYQEIENYLRENLNQVTPLKLSVNGV